MPIVGKRLRCLLNPLPCFVLSSAEGRAVFLHTIPRDGDPAFHSSCPSLISKPHAHTHPCPGHGPMPALPPSRGGEAPPNWPLALHSLLHLAWRHRGGSTWFIGSCSLSWGVVIFTINKNNDLKSKTQAGKIEELEWSLLRSLLQPVGWQLW